MSASVNSFCSSVLELCLGRRIRIHTSPQSKAVGRGDTRLGEVGGGPVCELVPCADMEHAGPIVALQDDHPRR